MKILFIHNFYQQAGGEDAVVRQEIKLLREEGHQVIEYYRDNKEVNDFSPLQKAMVPIRAIWSRDTKSKLLAVIQSEKPDVAHIHNTHFMISPSVYYTLNDLNIPVVQTLHNFRLLCANAIFYRDEQVCQDCLGKTPALPGIQHACYRDSYAQSAMVTALQTTHRALHTWETKIDRYIALTEFSRQQFIQGGLPSEKVVVKPNFLYDDPGKKIQQRDDFILFVGRLAPEKGVLDLLEAAKKSPQVPVKIVGDGPLMDEGQAYIQSHQLENVELLGRQPSDKVFELMRVARALVFPSKWFECFPMTIGESFACGLPIIATRLGAMEELIAHERTGLHFEIGNTDELARQLQWAYDHPEEMAQMGNAARQEFEEKYTAPINYQMIMSIYDDVIAQASQSN